MRDGVELPDLLARVGVDDQRDPDPAPVGVRERRVRALRVSARSGAMSAPGRLRQLPLQFLNLVAQFGRVFVFELVRGLHHLAPQLLPIRLAATLPGLGFGLGFSVVTDIGQTAILGSAGTFAWGGAYNTRFC